MLKVSISPLSAAYHDVLVLTVAQGPVLGVQGKKLDSKLAGTISRAIAASKFKGKAEQTLTILAPAKSKLSRILLVGIGEPAKVTESVAQRVGGIAYAAMGGVETSATMLADQFDKLALSSAEIIAFMGQGARLRSYSFDKYRTQLKADGKAALRTLALTCADHAAAKTAYAILDKVADGVFTARDLINEPANVIFPTSMAEACQELKSLGVKVEVLDEKAMKKLGMGALLGVAQGSEQPPKLVTMQWLGDPSAKDKRPVALVGKGVTFDSGGLSLKPPAGMEEMKRDMAGAAAVIGAMKALAGRKAKANVVGVVGLVENMPSGCAMRPGDIVTTMSGQTVEVLNTDAEGRLVLCDALWYTQQTFNPRSIVNIATLTGAIVTALGREYAGLFSNDDAISEKLTKIGLDVDEKLWRFPLADAYDRDIDSPIADMKNIGGRGEAGSITAAQFLQRFIKKGTPWAHLDIAGMAWLNKDTSLCIKGGNAFGVRLLERFASA